jgi:hypothetical protein
MAASKAASYSKRAARALRRSRNGCIRTRTFLRRTPVSESLRPLAPALADLQPTSLLPNWPTFLPTRMPVRAPAGSLPMMETLRALLQRPYLGPRMSKAFYLRSIRAREAVVGVATSPWNFPPGSPNLWLPTTGPKIPRISQATKPWSEPTPKHTRTASSVVFWLSGYGTYFAIIAPFSFLCRFISEFSRMAFLQLGRERVGLSGIPIWDVSSRAVLYFHLINLYEVTYTRLGHCQFYSSTS